MFTVLIACFDNWNTLAEVPYILKEGGFNVDILCGEKSWLKSNSFYDKWIPSEQGADEYIRQLIDLVNYGNYDWIIAGDEKLIKLLNENIQDESLFYKILPLTKIENREMLGSKSGLSNVCMRYDIRTPDYSIYHAIENSNDYFDNVAFPRIIKIDFSWGGVGIETFNENEEFNKALAAIPAGENAIIQEYIKGKEVPVEALFWKGRLLALACSEILEYDKDEFSYSTRRKYFPVDELLRTEVASFGEAAGLHGFVNMAYIKSLANHLYYLIEADTRPTSWCAYVKHAGVSFSGALRSITLPAETIPQYVPKTVEIALFYKDLRRGLYKRDIKGLLRWIYKISYWRYIPFYDRKLFVRIFRELWQEFYVDKKKIKEN